MKKIVLVIVAVIAAFLSSMAQSSSGFSYYKTITIDHTKVSGNSNLTDFPVLISVTDNALRTTGNGGRLQNNNGWDILFTNSTGNTNLSFQIESYTAANGNLVAWVRVPSVSHNTNTAIRIYYGKSGVVVNPSTNNTWTNDYKAIYHFNNSINDATSNSNNGTNHSSTNVNTAKIGQGRGFNGTQFITVPNSNSLNVTGNTITISAWANISSIPEDAPFAVKGIHTNQEQYMLGVDHGFNPNHYNMRLTTNAAHHRYQTTTVSLNQWAYVVMVYDGTLGANPRMRMFVNGALISSQNCSGSILSNTGDLHIGKRPPSDNRFLRGDLDELRISTVVKSADWIATEYNNQNSPPTFYTISSEIPTISASISSITHVSCNGGNNGSLTAAVSGGVAPFSYSWSGGGNTATKSNVTAGTYTVTVTDAAGVSTTANATVTQPAQALLGSILINQHETCNGCSNGSVTASATGGTSPYTYNWGGGNNNASRTNLTAGNYTVTITDNAGCTVSVSTTVLQNNNPNDNNILPDYGFRKGITIDNTKVCGGAAHTNFPILVSLTDADLRTLANGGKVQNSNGFDIVFTDSDGITLLDHQIEKYTASSGLYVAWVRIPSLPHNINKTIYMYFGKTGVIVNPSSNNVWDSGYKAVWHFNNSINDFSGNSNNGTNSGSINNNSGKIAEARSFNGSNQHISVSNSASLNITGNALTMSAWVKVPQNSQDAPFVVKGTTMNEEQYMMGIIHGSNRFLNRRVSTTGGHFRYDANTIPNDVWAYVVTVYDGAKATNPRFFTYINGSLVGSDNVNGTINSNTGVLQIGKRLGSDNRFLLGSVDELRLSNVVRSTDWICTEYNNQNTPSTFYTIGPTISTISASISSITHVSCNGGNNGSLTAAVLGGVAPFSYSWSGGGNTATKSNVTAGTYTVTVTDALGATITAQATVTQPAQALLGSIDINQHETCNGCNDGSITASATGGTSSYTYNWGGGNTNATRTNLSAGSYTVTVTDTAGCTTTASTTVNAGEGEPENNNALAGYEFRKAITIDNTKVCGTTAHTDFLVLVSVTDTDLRTLSNGGKVLNTNGFDIVFTDSDGNTLLTHQIEKYTASSGLFAAWVKIPSLPHNSNKVIYMYFGKTGVTVNTSSNDVWDSGYKAVWHFNNSINDFSGNSNNGTNSGSTNDNSGKIAEARSFNGSSQYISVPNSTSLNITGNALTMSAWVKVPQNSQDAPFVVKGTTMNEEQYMLGIQNGSNRFLNRRVSTTGGNFRYDANTIPNYVWAYLVTVYDGAKATNPRFFTYINGSLVSSDNANGTINSNTGVLQIGKRLGSDNRFLLGSVDELRLSNVVRSTDWICTEYNNQNSPLTFYAVGALEPLVPAGTIIWRGTTNQNWSTSSNWSTNTVPTATDSVYVPHGTANTLELNGSGNYNVKHIYFDSLATLSSAADGTLNIKGNLHVNHCGFTVNNGHIKFNGSVAQYIYAPCKTAFYRLYIENTSSTGVYLVGASVQVNHELYLRDGYLYAGDDTVIVARNSANNAIKEYSEDISHVVGHLTRYLNRNNDTYAFPVGKGADDASYLICIKNNNMEGISQLTIIFRDLEEDPQVISSILASMNVAEDGVTYNRLCDEGMWTIEPNIQPTNGSYNIFAHMKNFTSINSTDFGILKKPRGSEASNWSLGNGQRNNDVAGTMGQTISQIMRNSKAQRNGLTSFSDFGIGDNDGGTGLPIELISFTGAMNTKTKAADLFWTTATEINNEVFVVQRSLDGVIFQEIGRVAGAGNSSVSLNYTFADTKPEKGIAYYRLKQIDFDGKYAYSDLTSITNVEASSNTVDIEVKVYPNPTDGLIKIFAPTNEPEIHIQIIDINGSVIKSITANNDSDDFFLTMNLKDYLNSGYYFVKVSGQKFTSYKKIHVVK